MNLKSAIYTIFLTGLLLTLFLTCKKVTTNTVPTVTIADVTNITASTAHSGGEITSDGGTTVTTRGVCCSTNQSPTISDGKTTDGSGKGSFTSSIIGLIPEHTYNIMAYATNSVGTAYSSQLSFKTLALAPVLTTADLSAITSTTAISGGNITNDGGSPVTSRGVCWNTTTTPTIVSSKTSDGTGSGSFTSAITGLIPGAIYYIRAYATNSISTAYGNEKIVAATAILPVLTTTAISALTSTTAISGGNVTSDGGAAVTDRGVCWNTTANPTISNSLTSDGTGNGTFTSSITGLIPGASYYVRAYSTNRVGTAYGNEVTIAATSILPVLTTTAISALTSTTAISGGNITSDGGAVVTTRGVCWSTNQNPTITNTKTSDGTGSGSFTSSITGLLPGTTYYFRAYATNSVGTAYGNQITAVTNRTTASLPILITTAPSSITATTALSGGNISSDGGAAITVRGVCWSKSPNPTKTDSISSNGIGSGSFTSSITGLTPGTIYYFRAFATNSIGTSYGNQLTATTLIALASVSTTMISSITATTCAGGGNVISDGGAAVTVRGVCYGTNQNPTIANNKTINGSGLGSFSSSITGLVSGTTYYFRSYATNSVGTYYGGQVTATTITIIANLPILTTSSATAITATSVTSGGNITVDGGVAITSRGVCWSNGQSPTIANSKTINGAGIGNFVSSITGLTLGTYYYIRAYAINSKGTAYGNQLSFKTDSLPKVTTNAVSNITQASATGGGSVINDGTTSIIARGVCWSISSTPTINNNKTTNGTGSGSFSGNLSGLTANTTYYLRAYATNYVGTGYGEVVSFKTYASGSEFLTDIDGNVYPTVIIGTQVWMVENLKTTKYRNGDPIANITDANGWYNLTTGAYRWYDNQVNYKNIFGGLYNWYSVVDSRNIAPIGWHIPTDADWTKLIDFLGGENVAGGKLKNVGNYWMSPNINATNSSGFTAFAGGSINNSGASNYMFYLGYWWSSKESSATYGQSIVLSYGNSNAGRSSDNKVNGLSVRCVKD